MGKENKDVSSGGFVSKYLRDQFAGRGEPPQGFPLIDQRLSWERDRVERLQGNLDRAVLIVRDTEEYQRRLKLPTLSGLSVPDGIRYDPEGNLFTSWWRPVETVVGLDGKRAIARPREWGFVVLSARRHRKDVLTNLPKDQPVAELILGKGEKGIEVAIRNQEHILAGYKPGTEAQEVKFAREVIEYTEGIMTRFVLKGGVAKSDLLELATGTGQWLESQGIYNPRDPRKKRILEKLLTVPLDDKRGRANYLILLARVGAAHTVAVERLTVGGKTIGKFEKNLQDLAFERENTRWRLRLVDEHLEMIVNQLQRWLRVGNVTYYQRESASNALRAIAREPLTLVKVKPYLRAARWVGINIFGCREEKKEINRKILGEKDADKLFSRKSIVELIHEGKLDEAVARIKGCRSAIIKTLSKYEDVQTAGKA